MRKIMRGRLRAIMVAGSLFGAAVEACEEPVISEVEILKDKMPPAGAKCLEKESFRCSDEFDIPKRCSDNPCRHEVTAYQASATNPNILIPKIEYFCETNGEEPTGGAHDIDTATHYACSKAATGSGYTAVDDEMQVVLCYTLKTYALSCTASAHVVGTEPNKWADPENGEGSPGVTKVFKATCNPGVGSGVDFEIVNFRCAGQKGNCPQPPSPEQPVPQEVGIAM